MPTTATSTGTVFPEVAQVSPGHRGGYVLRREADGAVEFLVVTLWNSMEAVRAFAGVDPDLAVVEPAARAVLKAAMMTSCGTTRWRSRLTEHSMPERGPPGPLIVFAGSATLIGANFADISNDQTSCLRRPRSGRLEVMGDARGRMKRPVCSACLVAHPSRRTAPRCSSG